MKQLSEYTDAEKIAKFNKIHKICQDCFTEFCKPDNCDYFDSETEFQSLIDKVLETEQEDWDKKVEELEED